MKLKRLFVVFMAMAAFSVAQSETPAELENRLATAVGKDKLPLLIELCQRNLYSKPGKVLEYGRLAVDLLKQFPDDKTELGFLDLSCQACLYLGDYDQALVFGENSLALTRKMNDRNREGVADNILAIIYIQKGDYAKSREYALQAVEIFRGSQLESGKKVLASALNNIGISFDMQGDYEQSLDYYLQSLKIKEELGDKVSIARTLNNVGVIFSNLGKDTQALQYYERALEIKQDLDDRIGIASLYINIGNIYQNGKKPSQALDYYRKALDLYRELDNPSGIASALFNMGLMEAEAGQYPSAQTHFRQALELRRQMGEKESVAQTLIELGKADMLMKRYDQARSNLEEGVAISEEIGAQAHIRDGNLALSQTWESRGNFARALRHYKEYKNAADKIFNSESSRKIAEIQARYENEKKEQEIVLLKKNNEIQELRIHRQKMMRNLMLAAILLLVAAAVFLVYRYRYIFTFWKKKNYIGHYRIIEQMGSGGMGTVYRATDVVDASKRTIAVKVLREEYFSDEVQKKRFKQEASLIDQVVHPNIVHVIERGETDSGLYIAMEVLEGPTLTEFLQEQEKVPLSSALSIMMQIADALKSIHAMNIVHRDLKPDNIKLVEKEESPHFVKLLDFGLAMTQSMSRLTETGIVVGTIFYLSPEQIAGEAITTASDIHSLGVIFYEMLAGSKPFVGETTLDVMKQIISIEPIDISTYRADLNRMLSNLIMLMLQKEPRRRPTATMIYDVLRSLEISKQ